MKLWESIKGYLGAAILIGSMIFAVVRVGYNRMIYEAPDVTTIRICHWQLESGFREALQKLIDEYQDLYFKKHGKKVLIVQIPVSERGYQQYVNTGLIGGIAPDMIEKGMAKTANDPSYAARFFLPLGSYVEEPNPYNEGTKLAGLPWRETFYDSMESAYDRTLLDYYFIPWSMFTIRIYYNKNLYREITGADTPPKTFTEFTNICAQVKQFSVTSKRSIEPIAGSKYQGGIFQYRYENPFFFDMIKDADYNLDGTSDSLETCRAYHEKVWNFNSPRFLDSWQCIVDIAENFQYGWLAALRDDAVFMFVQGRALMIASGSWDASCIRQQVGSLFEIGVFDFPMPTDHPQYSKYVKGSLSEANTGGGIPWSITKLSRNPDICIDFLRFCTTQANNSRFTQAISWLPVITGTPLTPELEPFRPRVEGYTGALSLNIHPEFALRSMGYRWDLYSRRKTPAEFGALLTEIYERTMIPGYKLEIEKRSRNNRNVERILASKLFGSLVTGDSDRQYGSKIIQLMSSSQNNGHSYYRAENYLRKIQADMEK